MKTTDIFNENASDLNIGDPVVITGRVQFQGKTGDIVDFGRDKRFVIVNLYNYGKHSFHSSDVSYNDYADSGDEQEHLDKFAEGKTVTKFVGKWKGTDSADEAKKRLVGEAKSLQSKFEKHLKKHGYDVAEKGRYWEQKLKDIDAQIAAWDAEMAARKQGKETTNEDGGGYYYEQLAQKVFDENPNLSTKGRADDLFKAGWKYAVQDLGKKRAQWEFGYDEDFPSDFVSAYAYLQGGQQGVAESKKVDMTGKKCSACKKGTYQETGIHDDMDGVLHCTNCNKQVTRWQAYKEQGVAEDLTNPNAKPDKVDRKKEPNTRSERYYKNKEAKKKQGVAEGETTDVYRKVFKKNGKPVGEVGIDLEASPGNGDWYVKHYASGTDYSGYDTRQDAIDELKYMVSQGLDEQGVAEGSDNVRYKAHPTKKTHIVVTQVPVGHKGIKVGDEIARSDIKGWKGFSAERKNKGVAEDLGTMAGAAALGSLAAGAIGAGVGTWLKKDREKERAKMDAIVDKKKKNKGVAEGKAVYYHVVDDNNKSIKAFMYSQDAIKFVNDRRKKDPTANKWKVVAKKNAVIGEQGVAEGEYDPSYDPDYRPYQKPERNVDWDIEAERNQPDEQSKPTTVTIRDLEGNVVLQFPSTGGYYGDVRMAKSKGYDTEAGDYDIKWKRDANEDAAMTENTGATSEQVATEIVRKIIRRHPDAITAYGPEAIMAAAREVGEYFAGSEELGTSDVSIATKYTLDKLEQAAAGNLQETASAGATGAGSVAAVVGGGKNVGSLFGGTYKQKRTKKSPGTK